MWCSLLECYYDVGMKKDFKMLFGKTEIGRNPTELRNSFLILRLNFSTMVNLEPALLGMLGFTQRDVDRYVDEIYAEYGFDPAKDRRQVAAYAEDVKRLHPAKEVEAYVCSIVGNRSYAFGKVKV